MWYDVVYLARNVFTMIDIFLSLQEVYKQDGKRNRIIVTINM